MKNTLDILEHFSNMNIYTQWLRNNCFSETKELFKWNKN